MHTENRKSQILGCLEKADFVTIKELVRLTGASLSSVRRDILALERERLVKRIHGGARVFQPKTIDYAFHDRDTQQVAEKESIGMACAEILKRHGTVLIDAGTTCFHVAKCLGDNVSQIVTNSLPVANLYSSSLRAEVLVSGGMIYPQLGALIGPDAVRAFSNMHVDVAVLSASGLSDDGIYNSHALVVDIQRAMIACAAQVIFCLDHTKFDRRAAFFLTDFASVDLVVCDQLPPKKMVTALRENGVEIRVAGRGTISETDSAADPQ